VFFKKQNEIIDKGATATLYPTRIIIETLNKEGNGSYYSTDNVTVLPLEITEKELGQNIEKHLRDSIFLKITPDEQKRIRRSYKKKVKARSEKALMENARQVRIYFDGLSFILNSFQNKTSDKLFLGNPSTIKTLTADLDNEMLGNEIRLAWEKCVFI